jgi:hypothetical protein
MDGAGSGSCPVAGFGIGGVEPMIIIIHELYTHKKDVFVKQVTFCLRSQTQSAPSHDNKFYSTFLVDVAGRMQLEPHLPL